MDSPSLFRPAPRRGISGRLTVLVLSLPLASACYTYTEVGIEGVAPGESVRVQIYEQAVDRIPAELERRTQVEGTVVDRESTRLDLLPELGSPVTEPVSLAIADIEIVSRRELNQARTWLAAGVGAALGVGLLLSIEGDPASTGGGPITEFMLGLTLHLSR